MQQFIRRINSFESYWISISKCFDLLINAKVSVFRSSVNSCFLLSYFIYVLDCNTCALCVFDLFFFFIAKRKNSTFGFILCLPLLLLHIAVCYYVHFLCFCLRMCPYMCLSLSSFCVCFTVEKNLLAVLYET